MVLKPGNIWMKNNSVMTKCDGKMEFNSLYGLNKLVDGTNYVFKKKSDEVVKFK